MSLESLTGQEEERRGITADELEMAGLAAKVNAGANWFFWIAGMSLVNSLVAAFEGQWSFIIGLGITQVFDAFALVIGENSGSPGLAKTIAFCLDVAVAFVFVLFGLFARKRMTSAFIIGMVIYAADGLIFLLAGDWLSIGFHVFALYFIFSGFNSLRELKARANTLTI